MFIRQRTVRSSSGRAHTYLELVRTYRKDGKVRQERLCSLGRLDELRESGNIDRMIASLVKVAKDDWVRKYEKHDYAWPPRLKGQSGK